jgi:hypothetical protein
MSEEPNTEKRTDLGARRLGRIARRAREWPRKWSRGGDRTANATVLLALGTVTLALVNFFMLIEMHFSAHKQHKDTISALHKTNDTITALKEQKATMQGQLDEMRAEQRPWLFAPEISLQSPISRDTNGIRIPLRFKITNTGRLPARNVFINLTAFAKPPNNLTQYSHLENQNCIQPSQYLGISVFPGYTTSPLGVTTYISIDDIRKFQSQFEHLTTRPSGFVSPLVLACIVYKDPVGVVTYHTPCTLDLVRVVNGQACCVVPSGADELAKSQIIVEQEIESGMPPD